MNLLYLVFGNQPVIHSQANFSILTFLQQRDYLNRIIIVTDAPSYYQHIKDDKISIDVINDSQLNDWKGPFDFFWRIKIKAIHRVAKSYPEQSLLYLDADTFLYNSLDQIKNTLDQGHNIMHLNEGNLSEIKSKTTRKMWQQVKSKSFAGITITKNDAMWNAGAVGISKLNFHSTIPLALQICDTMCEQKVTDRLIEQFALSVALNKTAKLYSANEYIGHYWGNKSQWNQLISNFFLKTLLTNASYQDELKAIESVDFSKLPINIKIPNSRLRLIKHITKLYGDKSKAYIHKKV